MLEVVQRRRSIRHYTADDISEDEVRTLLEAAMSAPSARGADPWEFIVVRDRGTRERLASIHRWSYMASESPVVIVVCGDEGVSDRWVEDCSAATQNLLLQATDLGLGAVWVAIRGTEHREELVREILGIPPRLRVLCFVPVGRPAESKQARTRFNPAKVRYERY